MSAPADAQLHKDEVTGEMVSKSSVSHTYRVGWMLMMPLVNSRSATKQEMSQRERQTRFVLSTLTILSCERGLMLDDRQLLLLLDLLEKPKKQT